MPVELTVNNQRYFNQYNNGENFNSDITDITSNLVGSVMEEIAIVSDVVIKSYFESSETSPLEKVDLGGNAYKFKKTSGDFITDGFAVGDSISITGLTTSTFEFGDVTIMSGTWMTVQMDASSTFLLTEEILILNRELPTAIIFKTNLIRNNESFNIISKISDNDSAYYKAGITGSYQQMIGLGQFDDFDTGSAYIKYNGEPIAGEFSFSISQNLLIAPFYLEGWSDYLDGLGMPLLYDGLASLKYVFECEFRTVLSNPNSAKTGRYDLQQGSTAWFNENFNGFDNFYSISPIVYEDAFTGGSSDALIVGSTTKTTVRLVKSNGTWTSSDRVGFYVSFLPSQSQYSDTVSKMKSNFMYDNRVIDASSTTSTGSGVIKSIESSIINPTTVEIIAELEYSTSQQLVLNVDSQYIIGIGASDSTFDAGNSDKVVILADYRNYDLNADIEDLMTVETLSLQHYNDVVPALPVQSLATLSATQWLDISGNDFHADLLQSNEFEFDGSTNYIDTGVKVQGQTPINFEGNFVFTDFVDYRTLWGCGVGISATGNQGILLRAHITTGEIDIFVSDGTAFLQYNTGVILSAATQYKIGSAWSGLSGEDLTLSVNGSITTHTIGKDWVGDSFYNLLIGAKGSLTHYFKGTVSKVEYTFNTTYSDLIPFSVGESNKVYGVKTDTEHTIIGTVTGSNWVLQDYYHYNIINGFSFVSTARIPASLLNPGDDVLGSPLTNPAVDGLNDSETTFKLPEEAALINIDNTNEYFDGGGNAIEKTFTSLDANINDRQFVTLTSVSATELKQYQNSVTDGSDETEWSSLIAWNEDGIRAKIRFGLDTNKLALANSMQFVLLAYNNTTEEYFELDSYTFGVSNSVVQNGIQQFDFNDTRGYHLGTDSIPTKFNQAILTTEDNIAGIQYYEMLIGQKISWQDWIANLNVPTSFYNNSFPQNNQNFKSSNYESAQNYSIRVGIKANVFGQNDLGQTGNTDYLFLSPKNKIYDYEMPTDWSAVIETFHPTTLVDLGGSVLSGEDTLFKTTWTYSGGAVTDVNEMFCEHGIQDTGDNGYNTDISHNLFDVASNNKLGDLDALTIDSGNVVSQCLINGNIVTGGQDLTAKITVINPLVDQDTKITEDEVIKDTEAAVSKIIE